MRYAKDLQKIPEIVRLNYTTGNYSMFIEIVCKDINQLRSVLHDELQKIKGIERTETFISLEEGFCRNVKISPIRRIAYSFPLTSKASLNPFPKRLNARTRVMIAIPGVKCQHWIMCNNKIIILFYHKSPTWLWRLNTYS